MSSVSSVRHGKRKHLSFHKGVPAQYLGQYVDKEIWIYKANGDNKVTQQSDEKQRGEKEILKNPGRKARNCVGLENLRQRQSYPKCMSDS